MGRKLGFDSFFGVDCDIDRGGRRGGLVLLWNQNINIDIKSYSSYHIDALIRDDSSSECWRFSGIYGWAEDQFKWRTWNLIDTLAVNNTLAWVCLGDFNEILFNSEKRGGNVRRESRMADFRECLERNGLYDLGFFGNQYTWSNQQSGHNNIQERLDRVVANSIWMTKFPCYGVTHLARFLSDHAALFLNWKPPPVARARRKKSKLFRFEERWLQEDMCGEIIKRTWDHGGVYLVTDLSAKLHQCSISFLDWDKIYFSGIPKKIESGLKDLERLQGLYPSVENIQEIRLLENKLAALLRKEEIFWHQRSRICWMKEGDKNTKFFHRIANGRRRRNQIEEITDEEGVKWVEEEDIERVFELYYANLFTSEGNLEMTEAVDAVDHLVTSDVEASLSQPFSSDEIKTALFQMFPTKSPGPDGMCALFYQKFWSTVGGAVISSCLDVLNGGVCPSPLNHTYIALIPKKKTPETPADFRPISLCNVSLKIITKAIANRL